MASTVIDLITHLEKAMLDYNECQLWIFLESNEWKTFQSGCEDLMAFLEFSGHPLTASRVFQGFTDVTAAAQQSDKDSWLQDCFAVLQKASALLIRLKAISRSWNQLRPDPEIPKMTPDSPSNESEDHETELGRPRPDPYDNRAYIWMGKRLYLGHPDGRIARLFHLLARKLNYPVRLNEIQRQVDGIETREEFDCSPEEIERSRKHIRKDISTLRRRLREHQLDAHVDLVCEDAQTNPCYTLLVRGQSRRARKQQGT